MLCPRDGEGLSNRPATLAQNGNQGRLSDHGQDHRIDDFSVVKDTHVILSPATGETAHGQEAGKAFVPILQPVVDIKYKRVR